MVYDEYVSKKNELKVNYSVSFYVLSAIVFLLFSLLGIQIFFRHSMLIGVCWFIFCVYFVLCIAVKRHKGVLDILLVITYVVLGICLVSISGTYGNSNLFTDLTIIFAGIAIGCLRKYQSKAYGLIMTSNILPAL